MTSPILLTRRDKQKFSCLRLACLKKRHKTNGAFHSLFSALHSRLEKRFRSKEEKRDGSPDKCDTPILSPVRWRTAIDNIPLCVLCLHSSRMSVRREVQIRPLPQIIQVASLSAKGK